MKTDDLVALLANDAAVERRRGARERLQLAVALALPLSFMVLFAKYGLEMHGLKAAASPMFWVKLLFPLCVAAGAFVVLQRLARPGVPVRRAWLIGVLPVLGLWVLAAVVWFSAPQDERMTLLMGKSWRLCALNIAQIALPVFVGAFLALRGLAPTRLAWAGAAAGALAGGVGASVYALRCPELAAPFLAVWFVSGIAVQVLLGAVLGPRLLRW
ncbi:NrsF family protein [Acidovorax cavernicola]|uniref:DUF1109 domain-containing protein n=1 Tax=Acidovorax cavernicola TaxID=1675792 RepID=A0A9X8DA07_9BURK|nr:DUF1109 domain-containing protein [Acidovorax cavernicola]RIX85442.1 DUF1109 domain-containing protein [Acidovorax cavernicola]